MSEIQKTQEITPAEPDYRILFISNSNVGRSLMAESMMRAMVKSLNISDSFDIQSAATGSAHATEMSVDTRRKLIEMRISYRKNTHSLVPEDYQDFDYLIGMDDAIIDSIHYIIPSDPDHKIRKLLSFCEDDSRDRDVDDPWFSQDIDIAAKDIQKGLYALMNHLSKKGEPEKADRQNEGRKAIDQNGQKPKPKATGASAARSKGLSKTATEASVSSAPAPVTNIFDGDSGKRLPKSGTPLQTDSTFEIRLKESMREQQLTQSDLYKLCKPLFTSESSFSAPSLSNYTRGISIPSEDKIRIMAKALGVDDEWLRTGTGEPGFRNIRSSEEEEERDRVRNTIRKETEAKAQAERSSNHPGTSRSGKKLPQISSSRTAASADSLQDEEKAWAKQKMAASVPASHKAAKTTMEAAGKGDDVENISTRLSETLKKKGYTQSQLYQRCVPRFEGLVRFSAPALSNYTRGVTKPSFDKIRIIADALEVNPWWLWTGNEEPPKNDESVSGSYRKSVRTLEKGNKRAAAEGRSNTSLALSGEEKEDFVSASAAVKQSEEISSRLQKLLDGRGLRVSDLLRMCRPYFTAESRFSVQALSGYVKGQYMPSDDRIRILASALGVRFDWLKTGEGELAASPEEEQVYAASTDRIGKERAASEKHVLEQDRTEKGAETGKTVEKSGKAESRRTGPKAGSDALLLQAEIDAEGKAKNIAGRLRALMEKKGIDKAELYRLCQPFFGDVRFSGRALDLYINGTHKPTEEKSEILADALGVEREWLKKGIGTKVDLEALRAEIPEPPKADKTEDKVSGTEVSQNAERDLKEPEAKSEADTVVQKTSASSKEVSRRIREAMDQQGLDRMGLYNLCEILFDKTRFSFRALNYYVTGEHLPTDDKLEIIAVALGVEEEWLKTGSESPKFVKSIAAQETKKEAVSSDRKPDAKAESPKAVEKKPEMESRKEIPAEEPETAPVPMEIETDTIVLQYKGAEYDLSDINERCLSVWKAQYGKADEDARKLAVYVKPLDQKAYWVVNGYQSGFVVL